jgi:hypothetical protein
VVAAHYKKDDLLNCWTSSSDISGYHADFHEGHGTIGAGQGRGMAWQGNSIGAARARHAMCESAFTEPSIRYVKIKLEQQHVSYLHWGTNPCYDLHRHSSKSIRFTTHITLEPLTELSTKTGQNSYRQKFLRHLQVQYFYSCHRFSVFSQWVKQ